MISILKNIGLPHSATRGQTSSVGETSLGRSNSRTLISGNWYACESHDDELNWTHLSPARHMPPPPSGGFCCDQTIIYAPQHDIFIWLLQYMRNDRENVLRIAVKPGNGENTAWHWWDMRPTLINSNWDRQWLDYNHAALSDNFFYVGSNMYNMDDDWTRSIILRIPLVELAAGAGLSFDCFETDDNYSLRCVQGATHTMYFAAHQSTRKLRVFCWPEDETEVSIDDVRVSRWSGVDPSGGYSSVGPDGTDWLMRCDTRITAGWCVGNVIGFMWTANARRDRAHPHVRAVRVNTDNMKRIDEPDIWNESFAYAYPDTYPNINGDVGIALFAGGGPRFPSLVLGVYDREQERWRLQMAQQGTHGPSDNKWGDYLTCRLHPDGQSWVVAGFTQQGGGARTDIEGRYVHFEQDPDQPA